MLRKVPHFIFFSPYAHFTVYCTPLANAVYYLHTTQAIFRGKDGGTYGRIILGKYVDRDTLLLYYALFTFLKHARMLVVNPFYF